MRVKAKGTEAKEGTRASPLCLGDLILHKGLAGCSRLPVPLLFHGSVNKLAALAFLQIEMLPGMLVTVLLLFGFWQVNRCS